MFTIRKEELADCAGKLAPFLNEIADHALFLLDTSGCVLNWNAGAELLIGYTAQEIIGCHFSEFYTTEDVTAGIPRRALEMAYREEKYQAEGLMVRKGGSRFWSTLTLTPLRDADGNLQGFVNLTRDDTERRTNAAALRASEEKYRILFDSMSEAFVLGEPILDAAGNAVDNRYLAVNNAFYTQTGTSGRSVEGRRMRECFPQIEQSDIYRYAAVARTGQPDRFETYNDDTRRHYDVHAFSPIPGRFALLFRDITGLKLEEELRTFKVFSDHSSEGNLIADKGGRIRYVNRRLCERLGYSEEEMLQLRLQDITTNSTEGLFWEIVERTKDGSMLPFESIRRRKDGSTFPVEVSATALEVKGEWLIFVVTRDITERKRTEDALRASEEKYRALFANMTEGFIVGEPVFDSAGNAVDHRYLVVNEAFYAQTGLDEDIEGRRMRECFPRVEQFEIDRYAAVVRTGQPYRFDNYDADTRRYYHAYAFRPGPGRFAILFRDITEQKQVEDELRMFKFFSDHSSENTLVVDSKGRIRYANRRLCERLGYSDEEILRLDLQDISPKFTTESSFWEVVERTRDGSMVPFESSRRCKDGSIFPVEVSATALEVKGEWVAFVVSRDITERKRAEQALQESEERFRLLYENAPIGIIQVDQNEHVTAANWKFAEISGYSPEEALRITHRDVTLPEESAGFAKRIEDLYSGRIDTLKLERRLVRKDKSVTWVWETVRLTRDKQGSVLWGIVILEDINARKQAEEALRQSEEKFRATFEHAPLGLAEATVHGRFINANAKLVEMLGYTKDEILRLTTRDVTHPSELERTLSNHQKLAKGEADSYVMEQRYVRKDRSLVWVNVTASMVSFHGKPQYMVLTIEDISARKKVEEDLRRTMEHSYHQANHDMLTGLANRASFTDRLNEALAYARRDDHLVAIHLLDLDQFKSINDTQGHHIGDILLQEVAKRIKSHVRATDLVARVGGDEFVVIQTQLMEPSAAGILAGKLVEELGGKYILENQEVHSGASIGIAVFPGDTDNPEDLLKYADLALYEAKRVDVH